MYLYKLQNQVLSLLNELTKPSHHNIHKGVRVDTYPSAQNPGGRMLDSRSGSRMLQQTQSNTMGSMIRSVQQAPRGGGVPQWHHLHGVDVVGVDLLEVRQARSGGEEVAT